MFAYSFFIIDDNNFFKEVYFVQNPKISVVSFGEDGFFFINEIFDRKITYEGVNFATLIFDEEDLFFEAPWLIFFENFDNFSKILMENFSDTDIVFIISDELSMFIASRVLRVLKAAGIFCVGVFSFSWDFVHSRNYAVNINRYTKSFDLCFYNMNLCVDGFQSIFEFLTDLICKSGFVNLDFDDIKNFLKDSGHAFLRGGYFGGYNKVLNAAFQAISDIHWRSKYWKENVSKILVNITSSADVTLEELTDAVQVIKEKTKNPDVEIMWAHIIDEKLNNSARVSLIVVFKKD